MLFRSVALAFCVMAFVPALQAQGLSQGKGKAHQKQLDKIGTTVGGLSLYQQYVIGGILDNAQAKVDALAPSARRSSGGDIRKAAMVQVRNNLTPAQQKKFDAGH